MLVKRLAAGLAMPATLSATATTLASLLRHRGHLLSGPASAQLCVSMLRLLRASSPDVLSSALAFWLVAIKQGYVHDNEAATRLLSALWALPAPLFQHCRREIKIAVERLIKRLGSDTVNECMPNDDGRHLVQALSKKKRKKDNKHKARAEGRAQAKEERKEAKRKNKSDTRYVDPKMEDMLSSQAMSSGVSNTPFPVDSETGKPVIEDSDDSDEDMEDAPLSDDFVDEEDDEEQQQQQPANKTARKTGKQQKSSTAVSGEMYKSKKGEGDVKKGKFDPFAYVKLDPKNLNRRRAGRTADQYSDMFKKKSRVPQSAGHKRRVGKKSGGRYYN